MTHILESRVRQLSLTEGEDDIVFTTRAFGALAFDDVMSTGDTCDYVMSYADSFEEGVGTFQSDGSLERTTVTRSRHANGTVDTNKVVFAPGVKTVIMTAYAERYRTLIGGVRYDVTQTLDNTEKRRALDNMGLFPTGTKAFFQQTSAPAGWTKDTTHNDKAIRIVSGSVSSGGSSAFSTVFGKSATDSFTLTQTNLPGSTLNVTIGAGGGSHSHTATTTASVGVSQGDPGGGNNLSAGAGAVTVNAATLPQLTGTAALGGSSTAFTIGMDIRVQYVDTIIATKD